LNCDLPISAIGGIKSWQDAAELILLGATTIQVCTGVMWEGFSLGRRLAKGLQRYMKQRGYRSIDDFRGNALRYLSKEVPHDERVRVVSVTDASLCKYCEKCVIACRDAAFDARFKGPEGVALTDNDRCKGCGLCVMVCPRNAISLSAEYPKDIKEKIPGKNPNISGSVTLSTIC
jgi:dihydropyrimidine dehydrogenase (NAD+) subunit PreA